MQWEVSKLFNLFLLIMFIKLSNITIHHLTLFYSTDHAINISLYVCLAFFIIEFIAASATSVGNLSEIQEKGEQ